MPGFRSSGSSILAAEAEPITSNLDRLPPRLSHKKRKSESSLPQEGVKRTRGTRGGVLGRSRKSETAVEHSQPQTEEASEVNLAAVRFEIPSSNSAHRSSRKSTASGLEMSTPWDPTADVLMNGFGSGESAANATTKGDTDAFPGDRGFTAAPASYTQETNNETHPAALGISSVMPTKRASQPPRLTNESISAKQEERVSFSPETEDYSVKFFARISTSAGTEDIPLAEGDLTSEVGLLKRYAAWQNEGKSNVTFEVFKGIVTFAR